MSNQIRKQSFFQSEMEASKLEEILRRIDENIALRPLINSSAIDTNHDIISPPNTPESGYLFEYIQELRSTQAPLFVVNGSRSARIIKTLLNVPIKIFGRKQIGFNRILLQILDLLPEYVNSIQQVTHYTSSIANSLLSTNSRVSNLTESLISISEEQGKLNKQFADIQAKQLEMREQLVQLEQVREIQRGHTNWLNSLSAEIQGQNKWLDQVSTSIDGLNQWLNQITTDVRGMNQWVDQIASNVNGQYHWIQQLQNELRLFSYGIRGPNGKMDELLPLINDNHQPNSDVEAVQEDLRVVWLRQCGATIGANVFFGQDVYIEHDFAPLLYIEDGVTLARGVSILMHDSALNNVASAPVKFGTVHLGCNCYIGANSTILAGVKIGEGAVIGAGSVVTRNVTAGMVAFGSPASERGTVEDFITKQSQQREFSTIYTFLDLIPWRMRNTSDIISETNNKIRLLMEDMSKQ